MQKCKNGCGANIAITNVNEVYWYECSQCGHRWIGEEPIAKGIKSTPPRTFTADEVKNGIYRAVEAFSYEYLSSKTIKDRILKELGL